VIDSKFINDIALVLVVVVDGDDDNDDDLNNNNIFFFRSVSPSNSGKTR